MKRTVLLLTFIAVLTVGTATASEFTVPFGLATAPDARLLISDKFDTAGGDREESITRLGTKKTRQEVIAFYRRALEEAGFTISSTLDNAKFAMIAGKRDDDRIAVYYKNQSDWAEPGESEISINATYKK